MRATLLPSVPRSEESFIKKKYPPQPAARAICWYHLFFVIFCTNTRSNRIDLKRLFKDLFNGYRVVYSFVLRVKR